MALFFTKKKLPEQSIGTFLSPVDWPANCETVVEHIHASIRKHTGTQFPLYLFFNVACAGKMPGQVEWERWSTDALDVHELRSYPHAIQFAWVLCDEWQKVVMARNLLIYPEGFTIPPEAIEEHNISQGLAMERGVPMPDALKEFCACMAPVTRAVTFDAGFDAVVLEVEMRRHKMAMRFNRNFFHDVSERTREYCRLPAAQPDGQDYAKPQLQELYERLFTPFEIEWHDASAQVQVLQHCFFPLLKQRVI